MHNHSHHHSDGGHVDGYPWRLLWALGLTLSFALVEALAGWWSGSLALLGDSGHMLTDSFALGLAAGAAILARRAPSVRHSYGLGRAEILAALTNALAMSGLVVWIGMEAIDRLNDPAPVKGAVVMVVATVGLLINLGAAWLLSGDHQNLNVRAALLHVMGDLLGSVAALVSGAVILWTGWTTIDPILSLLIVILIFVSAIRILREALHALMEGVPLHMDLERIGLAMAGQKGVLSVHDLHIWSLSSSRTALSAHIVVTDLQSWPVILERLRHDLSEDFGIEHVTLQPEVSEGYVDVDAVLRGRSDRQGRSA